MRDPGRSAHAGIAREAREALGFARHVQNQLALARPIDVAEARRRTDEAEFVRAPLMNTFLSRAYEIFDRSAL